MDTIKGSIESGVILVTAVIKLSSVKGVYGKTEQIIINIGTSERKKKNAVLDANAATLSRDNCLLKSLKITIIFLNMKSNPFLFEWF